MKNMKFWRTALVATLVLTVMLSVTGGTIAWFTDEVTSGVNTIKAGNLDVDVLTANGASIKDVTTLFNAVTWWEPGAVAYENLTVVNKGNLALVYEMTMNATEENNLNGNELSDVLKVGVVPGGIDAQVDTRSEILDLVGEANWKPFNDYYKQGDLLAGEAGDTYGVVVYWLPTAEDNKWNANNGQATSDGQPLHVNLGIKLEATQMMAETDSFGNDYDEKAPYGKSNVGPYNLNVLSGGLAVYDEATKTYTVDVETVAQGGYNASQGGRYFAGYTVNVAGYGENATVSFDKADGTTTVWKLADEERDGFINNGVHQQWTSVGLSSTYRYDIDGDGATDFSVTNDVSEAKVEAATEAELLKIMAQKGIDAILTQDIVVTDAINIDAGEEVTIDLNGHDITQQKTQTTAYAMIVNKGTLTIMDSVGTGVISYEDITPYTADPGWASNTIRNEGVLNIKGGTVENVTSEAVKNYGYPHAIDAYQGSVTNISGGTVKSLNYDSIRMFCNSETLKTEVNISGGHIINRVSFQDPAANRAGYGVLNITGGTFTTTDEVNANVRLLNFCKNSSNMKATISGGTFDKGVKTQDLADAGVELSDWLSTTITVTEVK